MDSRSVQQALLPFDLHRIHPLAMPGRHTAQYPLLEVRVELSPEQSLALLRFVG